MTKAVDGIILYRYYRLRYVVYNIYDGIMYNPGRPDISVHQRPGLRSMQILPDSHCIPHLHVEQKSGIRLRTKVCAHERLPGFGHFAGFWIATYYNTARQSRL